MADEELKYPMEWTFRIVAEKDFVDDVRRDIGVIAGKYGVPCMLSDGLVSKGGSYVTVKFTVTVQNREMFAGIGDELGQIKKVKFVL